MSFCNIQVRPQLQPLHSSLVGVSLRPLYHVKSNIPPVRSLCNLELPFSIPVIREIVHYVGSCKENCIDTPGGKKI